MIKRILREPLFYLLPLLAVAYLIVIPTRKEISDIKITRNDKTEDIKLPYFVDMERGEEFLIYFNLSLRSKSAKFNIIPDDCIQEILINGEKFPLDGINGLCNYSKGVYFDFSKYVQEGLNHFELHMKNNGGPAGLNIEVPYNGFKSLSIKHYLFALLFLFSVALILRKNKFKFIAISIILLGIIVRLIFYTYAGPMQSPYDTQEHLDYIRIIAEEKRIPKSDEGWSTFHPPLYYVISAAIKNITDRYDPTLTTRFLQQESLLFSFASIVFGVAFLVNLFGNRRGTYLASLVLVLWPGFVIAAPRINNEVLFYFGALLCMLFAQKYWRWHNGSDMFLASLGASIALAAKATGFVILGVWLIIYIFNVIRSLKIGSLRALSVSVFIIALFVGFSNYRTVVKVFEGENASLVGNSSGLNGGLRVNNATGNYLYFDLQDYLIEPYTSPWADKGGRQYFWNYALKTSLFGELRLWNVPIGNVLATVLSALALLIFMLALWGMIHFQIKELPPLLFAICLFAALIYLRVSNPYSCSNDFRYIMPVIFPLVYFSIRGVQILENSRLRKLSYISMLSFAGLSFLFIVGQGF